MSLSGSTSEDKSRVNDIGLMNNDVQGPEPTAENPAGVFPEVGSQPAAPGSMPGSGAPDHHGDIRGVFGNPQVFNDTFGHLSSAFTDAINKIKDESGSGIGSVGKILIHKLETMRDEVDGWRMGKGLPEVEQAGGERNEDVDRAEGDGGGLYAD
ncbi:hypothetical protein I302_101404 [Kwoniella bestiolae CBS 10118]|uniref:Uncharacterized protein n=1 Tax=Kwoniella bestiolae CBS 10118 TaxID=1296100 RepID=A0A1B9GC48_9TREE|nr:hypothetical protein I302_00085 [Kwoniella bestiolae CBS 10118]OCF28597.1 hypothetical protein I302_00085 [Kwoniella bestiolae CBS 10118]